LVGPLFNIATDARSPRGNHQPATALACDRHAGATCETNNDHRRVFEGEGGSGREGGSRWRHFLRDRAKNAAPLTGLHRWRRSRESFPSFP
jgi:hypothetical protein